MSITRFLVSMFSIGMMVLAAGVVSGQNYPNKPIRIVTSEIGSASDFVARLIAQGLSASIGQQVIVDNRGGGGSISGDIVAKAPPDGYTLLVGSGTFWIGPLLIKTSYDPVKEFSPITLAASSPNIIVVHPSLPVKSVKALIALAKASLDFHGPVLG